MTAVFVNAAAVLLGSTAGILLGGRFKENFRQTLVRALGLCAMIIGVGSALKSGDTLCMIICLCAGIGIGEWIDIEKRIERIGEGLKRHLPGGEKNLRFTEGFVAASTLFCIGSMTIVGSLEAGVNHNPSIIYAKSAMDCVTSLAFAATMGWGVACSALFILVFQGGLTLLSGFIGPYLGPVIVNEMSAVGGVILIAICINLLELGKDRLRAANMLPAVFMPIIYIPLAEFLKSLFS